MTMTTTSAFDISLTVTNATPPSQMFSSQLRPSATQLQRPQQRTVYRGGETVFTMKWRPQIRLHAEFCNLRGSSEATGTITYSHLVLYPQFAHYFSSQHHGSRGFPVSADPVQASRPQYNTAPASRVIQCCFTIAAVLTWPVTAASRTRALTQSAWRDASPPNNGLSSLRKLCSVDQHRQTTYINTTRDNDKQVVKENFWREAALQGDVYMYVYPSGRSPAYSGPIRWGLFTAGPLC